ncbi:FAD-dependent oxidoreductase, partial [Flavihumibacter sediminis]|nr:FAD-dependent oxidoreductase [Flavihumibacter sediminis]
ADRLMPRQLDESGAEILTNTLTSLGLSIHTGKNTARICGKESITGLEFTDGTSLETDLLVVSAGIRPRGELAVEAGLETGMNGGIVVNNFLQTSDPS